jgi:short-subunit dehydrogenase
VFGLFSVPTQSAYNAAKFAVRGFTEALRQEMLTTKRPVKVTCVHPGGIKTNIARNADQSDGRDHDELSKEFDKLARMSPEKAARIILRGVERGRARVLIGIDAHFLDAFVRVAGPAYQGLAARFSKSRGL